MNAPFNPHAGLDLAFAEVAKMIDTVEALMPRPLRDLTEARETYADYFAEEHGESAREEADRDNDILEAVAEEIGRFVLAVERHAEALAGARDASRLERRVQVRRRTRFDRAETAREIADVLACSLLRDEAAPVLDAAIKAQVL